MDTRSDYDENTGNLFQRLSDSPLTLVRTHAGDFLDTECLVHQTHEWCLDPLVK